MTTTDCRTWFSVVSCLRVVLNRRNSGINENRKLSPLRFFFFGAFSSVDDVLNYDLFLRTGCRINCFFLFFYSGRMLNFDCFLTRNDAVVSQLLTWLTFRWADLCPWILVDLHFRSEHTQHACRKKAKRRFVSSWAGTGSGYPSAMISIARTTPINWRLSVGAVFRALPFASYLLKKHADLTAVALSWCILPIPTAWIKNWYRIRVSQMIRGEWSYSGLWVSSEFWLSLTVCDRQRT